MSRSKTLQPNDIDSLTAHNIPRELIDGNQAIIYNGTALTTKEAGSATVKFEFKTDSVRNVEIDIPFFLSVDAHLTARVNDSEIQLQQSTLTAEQNGKPILHRLIENITIQTRPQVGSHLQLIFSFAATGTVTILNSGTDPSMQPVLNRTWASRDSWPALAFFVMTWLTILFLLIIIVAWAIPATNEYKVWAVFLVLAPWLVSVLGVSDLIKVKIRDWVRWLFVKSAKKRPPVFAVLGILFVAATVSTIAIVHSLSVHYRYTRLIETAIQKTSDEDLRRAFVLQPWRKEAQVLFESRASVAAKTGNFRDYVKGFVDDQDIAAAVERERIRESPPLTINTDVAGAYNDPVVWYASLLPQAEEESDSCRKEKAISILSSREQPGDVRAKLLKSVIHLNLVRLSKQDFEEDKDSDELRQFLSGHSEPWIAKTHEYQLAWDTVGQNALSRCIRATEAQQQPGLDEAKRLQLAKDMELQLQHAIESFRQVLEARIATKEQLSGGEPLWVRPPGHLLLRWIFKYSGSEGKDKDAKQIKENEGLDWGKCDKFEDTFKKQVFEDPRYAQFGKTGESGWLQGTVLEEGKAVSYIRDTLLSAGWRF